MERRSAERVQFAAPITIGDSTKLRCGGYGKIVNISEHGALLRVAGKYAIDDQLTVSIHLVKGSAILSVTMPGVVTRTSPEGIGFHSPHLDMSSLLHFGDLLQCNQGNSLQLQNDFFTFAVDALYPFAIADHRIAC